MKDHRERRQATIEGGEQEDQQVHQEKTKAKKKEAMKQILEKFSGIKKISQIQSARKKTLILKMKNEKRETVTSRKGIANVFGEFHSKLHDEEKDVNGEDDHCRDEKNKKWRRQENEDKMNEILEFSKMRCRLQSTA